MEESQVSGTCSGVAIDRNTAWGMCGFTKVKHILVVLDGIAN